ncbi:hypothetical protein CUA56_26765, partial [Shigella boydii]|uniref:transposase n=1 Tax=Shigella TaxID=620 RepID=UPI000ECCCD88
ILGRWWRYKWITFHPSLTTRVHESGSAEFRRVAAGMEADAAAICEAISSSWSNGVVEGHVNRLKMLKRQMYGKRPEKYVA